MEMKGEFEKMRVEMQEMKSHFKEILPRKNEEISELHGEIKTLKIKVKEMENVMDDNEAYERRDTVVISGAGLPIVERGENCCEIVRDIIKHELNLDIPATEISTSHRIGSRPNNQTADKRNFIVKFCRRDFKREVILASKRVRSPTLIVHENLTPKRRNIFMILRRMKQDCPDLFKGV